MYDKNTPSYISSFRVAGEAYEHQLFYRDDDRIECKDSKGNVVLTYTRDSYVYAGTGAGKKLLGTFHMNSERSWYFSPSNRGERVEFDNHTIIAAEVEFSKMYLRGELTWSC